MTLRVHTLPTFKSYLLFSGQTAEYISLRTSAHCTIKNWTILNRFAILVSFVLLKLEIMEN